MCVFGTRPEAIKMCPIIKELNLYNEFNVIVCSTGQHKEMLEQVLNIFKIVPDHNLNVMKKNSSLSSLSALMLDGISKVFEKERPDLVLVHGDTTTAFIAALAAFYQKIPIGHVEAGLRTYNEYSPYPEEMNRRLISKLAKLHFAPTKVSRENLCKEGIESNVYVTGNTAIDVLKTTIHSNYYFHQKILNGIDYEKRKCILLTVHRRENLGKPLENIFSAVIELVDQNENLEIVYPVHLNPIIQECAYDCLSNIQRIHLVSPLDLLDMHNLMKRCFLIMTDSGGIQEEAPSCNVPVIVLREETERIEAVTEGAVLLSGTKKNDIIDNVTYLLKNKEKYERIKMASNPYGDGNASKYITEKILEWCDKLERTKIHE